VVFGLHDLAGPKPRHKARNALRHLWVPGLLHPGTYTPALQRSKVCLPHCPESRYGRYKNRIRAAVAGNKEGSRAQAPSFCPEHMCLQAGLMVPGTSTPALRYGTSSFALESQCLPSSLSGFRVGLQNRQTLARHLRLRLTLDKRTRHIDIPDKPGGAAIKQG
jgi:hypothetical protein